MRRAVVGLPLLVFAVSCGGDPPLHPFFRAQRLPLIFAHRGGGSVGPEETVPTFLGAWQRNHEAVIEFDVLETADGEIVVLHDATVDRTTNGAGRVADLTLAEVQALDAGYCATPNEGDGTAPSGACHDADPARFPFRGMGYKIPTLNEV